MLDVMIDQLAPRSQPRPFGIKEEKHRLGDVVRGVAPNWFAAVMGTGIVAIAAATLPLRVPGLRSFALAVWALAAVLLVVFTGALAAQWIWHRERTLAHRGAARAVRRGRAGAADAAGGVLRDVRHQLVRVDDHHSAGVVAAGHLQDAARRHGAHVLDRARAARAVDHRGREPGPGRGAGPARAVPGGG
jgi:Voltage-dependent anion channel